MVRHRHIQYAAASIDGTSAPVTVTIRVAPKNDAPTADIAAPYYYVNEQEPLVLQGTGLHGDVDGGQMTAAATLAVDYGVLTADVGSLPGVTISGPAAWSHAPEASTASICCLAEAKAGSTI